MLYDAFFVPPKCPEVGDADEQCLAVVAVRNPAGQIVRYHALLTEDQWAYHKIRDGRGFGTEKLFVGRSVNSKDKDGNPIVKIAPIHSFFGRPVVDGITGIAHADEFTPDGDIFAEESVE